ncbi:uncharacterized protein LOC122625505 [Drosophila teissieri]|uniref:uncharacterized protein LOC122625505 n=1 Tax=Drosophila teissieri TaxID=7243 RepID=UPI001CBA31F0|nr:uncharacterized protein LOC122625505 [Drosophila teissieri]
MLSGRAEKARTSTQVRCHRVLLDTKAFLKRFCEVESVPYRPTATHDELWCESFFQKTVMRRSDGRYVVRSPERWSKYVEEIEEYFTLEQIAPAVGNEDSSVRNNFTNRHVAFCVLPHHAVFKKDPQATKQRLVFDASSRTSHGRSLNDILWTGQTLQNTMSAVILNWRKYRFVFTAYIQKMYRCIDVHPEDAQYQRILWRAVNASINVYALSALKFGKASKISEG